MNKDIGKKVKELRTRKKMTLKELSEQTNLSTGFLSQLERGLTAIATDSLEKIAEPLGVDLSYFFKPPKTRHKVVLRSYEKEVFQVESSGVIIYHLTQNPEDKIMLPRLIELLPIDSEEHIDVYPHEGEEFIYVLEGILTLFMNHEQYELYPGDTAHYSSKTPHNWANYTNKVVKIIANNTTCCKNT